MKRRDKKNNGIPNPKDYEKMSLQEYSKAEKDK